MVYRLLACLSLLTWSACGPDATDRCTAAYEHLVEIAERNHDEVLMNEFIGACVDVEDNRRIDCLMASETPLEALACEARKKRPG
ncbi:MAG: hypothetical protein ACI9MR_001918 [Myxococcota bacterium]|jgi:hypothetical protein